MPRGGRKRQRSRRRYHKRALKGAREDLPYPRASDVEVRDATTGEVLDVQRALTESEYRHLTGDTRKHARRKGKKGRPR